MGGYFNLNNLGSSRSVICYLAATIARWAKLMCRRNGSLT